MPDTTNQLDAVSYRGFSIQPFLTANARYCARLTSPDGQIDNLDFYPKTVKSAIESAKDDIDRKLGGGPSNRAMAELAGATDERDRFDQRDANDPQDR